MWRKFHCEHTHWRFPTFLFGVRSLYVDFKETNDDIEKLWANLILELLWIFLFFPPRKSIDSKGKSHDASVCVCVCVSVCVTHTEIVLHRHAPAHVEDINKFALIPPFFFIPTAFGGGEWGRFHPHSHACVRTLAKSFCGKLTVSSPLFYRARADSRVLIRTQLSPWSGFGHIFFSKEMKEKKPWKWKLCRVIGVIIGSSYQPGPLEKAQLEWQTLPPRL